MPKKLAPLKESPLANFVLRYEKLLKLKHRLDTGQHVYVRELIELLGPGVPTKLDRIRRQLAEKAAAKPWAITEYEAALSRADLMHKLTVQLKRRVSNGKINASNLYYSRKIPAYELETQRLYQHAASILRDEIQRNSESCRWFKAATNSDLLQEIDPNAFRLPQPLSAHQIMATLGIARGRVDKARKGALSRHRAAGKKILVEQAIEQHQVVYSALDEALQNSFIKPRTPKGRPPRVAKSPEARLYLS